MLFSTFLTRWLEVTRRQSRNYRLRFLMHNLDRQKIQSCCEYHITPAVVKIFREINIVLKTASSAPVWVLRPRSLFCVLGQTLGDCNLFQNKITNKTTLPPINNELALNPKRSIFPIIKMGGRGGRGGVNFVFKLSKIAAPSTMSVSF